MTCGGGLGGEYLPQAKVVDITATGHVERIRAAVRALAGAGIDLLMLVGGDGFASYCAEEVISHSFDLPLLCVAGGTANVGPLIGFDEEDLRELDIGRCVERSASALQCSSGGRTLGYGFNDIVVGDTFLGSVDGKVVNIALEPFLATGEKRPCRPSPVITGPDFSVVRNGVSRRSSIARPSLIVAAPLNEIGFYRGKAALGAVCMAPWTGKNAVLAISDRNWIDTEADTDGERLAVCEQLLFGAGDIIEISGLSQAGQLLIDGNPFRREAGAVALSVSENVVTVLLPATRKGKTYGKT
jgi:hypothetical protein